MIHNGVFLFNAVIGACISGRLEIYDLVINKISYPFICTNDNVVQYACESGNINMVKFFMDSIPKDKYSYAEDWRYSSYMFAACCSGNLELVDFIFSLITSYVSDYMLNNNGNSPLYFNPYFNAHSEFDSEATHNDLNRSLAEACKRGNIDIVKYFISKGFKGGQLINDCLFNASALGNTAIIDLLLENNQDVPPISPVTTIANGACYGGHMNIIKDMINQGFVEWDEGLMQASIAGHMDIVKLMVENGAHRWDTAALHACQRGHINIVKFMLEKGAVNAHDYMHYACYYNDINLVNLLIDKGATNWNTGLEGACTEGHFHLAKLMIEHGASNFDECLRHNMQYHCSGNFDVCFLLIISGATNLDCLAGVYDFRLYSIYQSYCRYIGAKFDNDKHTKLIRRYPPYVLLLGSQVRRYRDFENGSGGGNSSAGGDNNVIKKLPIDIFRLLFTY